MPSTLLDQTLIAAYVVLIALAGIRWLRAPLQREATQKTFLRCLVIVTGCWMLVAFAAHQIP